MYSAWVPYLDPSLGIGAAGHGQARGLAAGPDGPGGPDLTREARLGTELSSTRAARESLRGAAFLISSFEASLLILNGVLFFSWPIGNACRRRLFSRRPREKINMEKTNHLLARRHASFAQTIKRSIMITIFFTYTCTDK